MATPQTEPQRMTADEFAAAFGESEREDRCTEAGCPDLELIDGVVVEGEIPSYRHQQTLAWFQRLLDPWARAKGGGTWQNAELRLTPYDVREPDLIAWWSGQTVPLDGQMTAVPDLAVEIISPRPRDVRRDREEKLDLYCRFGIPHYWTVEPIHRTVECFLRQMTPGSAEAWQLGKKGWEYRRVALGIAGILTPPVGPALDLDALWAYVER